jgi:hypothetical protein
MGYGVLLGPTNGLRSKEWDHINLWFVISAKAGTKGKSAPQPLWVPASAGMTKYP